MVGIDAEAINGRKNQFSEDNDNGNSKKRSWDSTEGGLDKQKKRRGRPLGSKNKAKAPVMVGGFELAATPLALNLQRGSNIIRYLGEFSKRNEVGISILRACGAVNNVKIQCEYQGGVVLPPRSLTGAFELKKLWGSFMPPSWNLPSSSLSATMEGPQGQISGDIFGDSLWAAVPVTIVVTCLANPVYHDIDFSQDDDDAIDSGNGTGSKLSSSTHQNNGFPLASSSAPLPPPPPPSQENVLTSTAPPHQPEGMNNGYSPSTGFLNSVPTLVSWPNPANGYQ